ncbi:MAG TPA: DUF4178 domain-containing protein [Candidatus Hydrogenedentes bacterium]|nr:DUF4178 domain-containing protein [Candidatus Hydrogenedentota bacterium]
MSSSLAAVRPGDSISLNGVPHRVEQIDSYCEDSEQGVFWWCELKLSGEDGAVSYLEWSEQKPGIYLYGTPGDPESVGLDGNMLADFDEEEEGSFSYDGRTYYYDDSGEAVCFEGRALTEAYGAEDGEACYYWDFYDESRQFCISVEQWESEIDAYFGVRLDPAAIEAPEGD